MAQPSPVARGGEPLRPDEVRRQVRVYLAEYFMTGDLPDEEALLVDDLGADSLDLLQVAHTLNDIFDIDLDADALPQMLTVGGVCEVVVRLRCGHCAVGDASGLGELNDKCN